MFCINFEDGAKKSEVKYQDWAVITILIGSFAGTIPYATGYTGHGRNVIFHLVSFDGKVALVVSTFTVPVKSLIDYVKGNICLLDYVEG